MGSPMQSLAVRAGWGLAHASANGTGTGVGTGSQKNGTAAQNFIQALVFAESKSVRTSTIILATFNALAAFATAASILYDCYWASKRCNPKFKASYVKNCRDSEYVLTMAGNFAYLRFILPRHSRWFLRSESFFKGSLSL